MNKRACGWLVLLWCAALWPGHALAQGGAGGKLQNQIQELQNPAAEAELPDIDAIEKGARPPASVSFRNPNAPPSPPPADAKSATAPAPGSDGTPEGSSTGSAAVDAAVGIYGLDQGALGGDADGAHAQSVPEFHTVKKGDTLWSLCNYYYTDPWKWPKLWADNPAVTNPHWIFPGDVVRLRAHDAPAAPPVPEAGAKIITSNRAGSLESKAVMLRQLGFIDHTEFVKSGVISGSREEKIMLASNDQAYVKFAAEQPLKAGERYTVYQADTGHPVVSPETHKVLGYMVRVYGDLLIDQVADRNTARGTLADLNEPVERGYTISQGVKQFKKIEPRPSSVNLEARVLAAFTPTMMLAAENFVVLGRGKKDGIEAGNRTFVVRRGDGYRPVMEGWEVSDPNFPKEVVGELWIMDVRENTSVAWIARTTKEIRVGELTELRKGH